jgi:hypothetical protein
LLGAPASRRQEAARSRILKIQKQIRHMIRDYSLLVLLRRRDAGAPACAVGNAPSGAESGSKLPHFKAHLVQDLESYAALPGTLALLLSRQLLILRKR